MFDVYWTDPDRELVGEHRARKEKKREQKAKQKEREQETSTIPRSASAVSTTSSTESRFGFLRPRNGKQAKSRDKTKSGLLTPSQHSSRSNSGSYHRSALMANLSELSLGAARAQRANVPASASASASASMDEAHIWSRQEPNYHAIKHAGASQTPPRSESDKPELSIDVRVSSEADIDHPATPSDSVGEGNDTVPILQNDSIPCLVPSIRLPKAPKAPIIINFRANDPDSWRPPEEWEYIDRLAEEARQVEADEDVEMKSQRDSQVQSNPEMDFVSLKNQVNQMATASPAVVLARIKEIWSVTDESLHPALNMELKQWMLSVLNHMDIEKKTSPVDASDTMCESASLDNILALHESQITASYLAALHPTKQVHHLPAEPLSTTQFAKVHPMFVPSMTTSTLPLEKHVFETVHSLSLPSSSPSTAIPGVLKKISKYLRVGGSLHLTLINPLPCAGTLGHRMRTWLEEHLLINLERQFRCTNPSKLFPDWMGDAGLRGQGSTLTTSKFYAVSASIRSQVDDSDPFIDKAPPEREVKAEVRSIVGRLLWMEVWGNFVTGEKWWWEDEGCVNECLQLGTVWDYHIIEGVKQEETIEQIEE
ncbi:hypothetical protein FLAG1_04523 [Fusarium langsethiae]|uniref:Uncharacterized protein n=1 Tax=Fusarium langsethiae TaxID=179993 RepID=A0A0N0DFH6_FUSLA|nr:hypothetical protein FLAG1_04523 [Fusarium langsethiae]GKU02351.1 unnamed protein product [Fusarium langsethiae]